MQHTSEPRHDRAPSGDPVSPLPPALWPARVVHTGRFVQLEPLDSRRHAEELHAATHDVAGGERLWDYLGYGPFAAVEHLRTWTRDSSATSDPLFFAIRDLASDTAVGVASYLNIVPKNGTIEIGNIWFAPVLQQTPAATEALYLMMRHAFDDLGNRRLEWKCNALNAPSRRAAVRLGFAFEGIFYQHMIVKGRNRDTAWFSLLDHEWPAFHANFTAWLAPTNFAADGTQRQSLSVLNRATRAELTARDAAGASDQSDR